MASLQEFEGASRPGRACLTWFNLGDRDLATHLFRTGRLGCRSDPVRGDRRSGPPFRRACPAAAHDRRPGRDQGHGRAAGGLARRQGRFAGLAAAPPPAPGTPPGAVEIGFQEYFVGLRHDVAVRAVRFVGTSSAVPGPGVLDAIGRGRLVVICPSNPVVSIGPVLAVPGIAEAVARRRETTVAVSPIIAGKGFEGPGRPDAGRARLRAFGGRGGRLWAPLAADPGRGRGRRRPGGAGRGRGHALRRRPVGHVRAGGGRQPGPGRARPCAGSAFLPERRQPMISLVPVEGLPEVGPWGRAR